MLKTEETKALPYYCLGVLGACSIFGMPRSAGALGFFLNGGPIAWLIFQIIITVGTYNLSQIIRPGGRALREALLGNPVPPSANRIFGQAALLVCTLWLVLVLADAGLIWYNNSFAAMLDVWAVWPELAYSIAVSFASIILIASAGIYRSFIGAYFVFQILYFISSIDVTLKELKPLLFLNDYPVHPFPLFDTTLTKAQNWPTYNLANLMACPALFAFAYKRWREKQWYLRKA